jgi:hypothetical protein
MLSGDSSYMEGLSLNKKVIHVGMDNKYNMINQKQEWNDARTHVTLNDLKYCKKFDEIKLLIDEIKENLIIEQIDNLNCVSKTLFNSNYNENHNNFVLFPIDIYIDITDGLQINYKIKDIPIFNRIIIETNTECNILLSRSDKFDPEVQKILDIELPQVRSYLNQDKPIECIPVNTLDYHRSGGNLHCLIKNIY